jgi:iron complex outermembrane receptor protein
VRINKNSLLFGAVSLVGLSVDVTTAQAEDKFEQVIVTARRVDEVVQQVPISITALTSQQLEEKTFINMGDLDRLTPGLFYNSFGGNNAAPTLRGIGTTAAGDVVRAVIPYFAEVPAIGTAGTPPAFDLTNIQVLKGPQGTLFGRNAFAGAILMTPRDPSHTFGGYIKGALGNYNYSSVEAAVDIPIVENVLAARFSGLRQRRAGYAVNISGRDLDDLHEDDVRANILYQPTNDLTIQQIFDYRDSPQAGQGFVSFADPSLGPRLGVGGNPLYGCASGDPRCNLTAAIAEADRLGPYKHRYTEGFEPLSHLRAEGSTTKISYTLNDINLVNIIGYRYVKNAAATQVDGLGLTVPIFVAASKDETKQWTEEFHVDSTSFDDRLSWITGVFYSHQQYDSAGAFVFTPFINPVPATYQTSYRTIVNTGLYGQVTWDFSEAIEGLKLDIGIRENWDSKHACFRTDLPAPTFFPIRTQGASDPLGGTDSCSGFERFKYNGKVPTWTVALNYQVSNDLLTYVTSRRGYREGTMNSPNLTGTILQPYQDTDPEKLTDIEIGEKWNWRLGDVTGLLNIAAYHQWYTDRQVLIAANPILPSFCRNPSAPTFQFCVPANKVPTAGLLLNGGKQQMSGVELEAAVNVTSQLRLSVNGAYTHIDSTSLDLPPFAAFTGLPPILLFSPEWAGSAAVRYELPFHPLNTTLVFNLDYTYMGETAAFGTRPTPAWNQTGARLDWLDVGRKGLNLSAFVTNLFDEENALAMQGNAGTAGFDSGPYRAPRMFGAEAKVMF